ncbi:hypothetical protein EGW08_021892, partial [Elysia chlorotica]
MHDAPPSQVSSVAPAAPLPGQATQADLPTPSSPQPSHMSSSPQPSHMSGSPQPSHMSSSPQPSHMSGLNRAAPPKTGLLSPDTSASLARRFSLPDPSAMTKQQIIEALQSASDIRDKYCGGPARSEEKHAGSSNQPRSQRGHRLLSDDTRVTPTRTDSTLGSDPRLDQNLFTSSTSRASFSPAPARPVGSSSLRSTESNGVTSADSSLRGKLAGMTSLSLLPSKQTHGTESVPGRPSSPSNFRLHQDSHSSAASNRRSSLSPSLPTQRRGSASPSIPDIRGFQPVIGQHQPRRRSLRSDGLPDGLDGQATSISAGSGSGMESFRPRRSSSSDVTPSVPHTRPGDTHATHDGRDASYSDIDTCMSELELTEMLTTSDDFNERRRIRARMRELKSLQQRKGSNTGTPTRPVHSALQSPVPGTGYDDHDARDGSEGNQGHAPYVSVHRGHSALGIDQPSDFSGVSSVTELQRLLAQSESVEERHRLRNAIRDLRQADIGK